MRWCLRLYLCMKISYEEICLSAWEKGCSMASREDSINAEISIANHSRTC